MLDYLSFISLNALQANEVVSIQKLIIYYQGFTPLMNLLQTPNTNFFLHLT
jgi:hypothetical protein